MICSKLAIIFISQPSNPNKFCIFASAYKSKVSSMQEKHCEIVLTCKFGKISIQEDEALLLSLVVYAIPVSILSGVRYVS